jgi:hypothetical protein
MRTLSTVVGVDPHDCSPEVRRALARGGPVVALESAVIAAGPPGPDNFDLACEFESVVREAGACPATIAVIDGRARIGLHPDELDRIATRQCRPLCSDDLPAARERGLTGATTFAATAVLAARAGIRILAAGTGARADDIGEPRITVWPGPDRLLIVRAALPAGPTSVVATLDNVRLAARLAVVWAAGRAPVWP